MVPILIYAKSACAELLWGLGCIAGWFHLDGYIMALEFSVVVILTHPTKIWRIRWGPELFLSKIWKARLFLQPQGKIQVLFFIGVHVPISCTHNYAGRIIKTEVKNLSLSLIKHTFWSGKYFLKNNFGVFSKWINSIHYCCNSLFIIFSQG